MSDQISNLETNSYKVSDVFGSKLEPYQTLVFWDFYCSRVLIISGISPTASCFASNYVSLEVAELDSDH